MLRAQLFAFSAFDAVFRSVFGLNLALVFFLSRFVPVFHEVFVVQPDDCGYVNSVRAGGAVSASGAVDEADFRVGFCCAADRVEFRV